MSSDTESNPDDRGRLVVRMAIHVFGDDVRAADWLLQSNDLFAGQSPLAVAKSSVTGCGTVVRVLDEMVALRLGY